MGGDRQRNERPHRARKWVVRIVPALPALRPGVKVLGKVSPLPATEGFPGV